MEHIQELVFLFRMTSLLRKFRIDYSSVIEVQGVTSNPSPERYVLHTYIRTCGV